MPIAATPRFSDIVLIHAGTNDILGGNSGDVVAQRLNVLLVTLLMQNRQAMVLVAQILPIYGYGKEEAVQTYNNLIPNVVDQFKNWGRIVQVVDMYSGFKPQDFLDGVHPTPEGYSKMGVRWKTAINALPSLPPFEIPGTGETTEK